jgi:hypothetical protein
LLVFEDGLRHLPLLEIFLRRIQMFGLVISHLEMLFPLSLAKRINPGNGGSLICRGSIFASWKAKDRDVANSAACRIIQECPSQA